ncbi:MAG: chromophore lyase CpcT/CpeT [Pseudomonadota bacterium]
MTRFFLAALLATGLAACVTDVDATAQVDQPAPTYLDELADLSVGSFTTVEQSARDDRYGVAEAEIIRIWSGRSDGVWLYQEQAYLGDRPNAVDRAAKERPYFARVIHNTEVSPGVVRRTVHKITDAERVRGAWNDPTLFSSLSPETDLSPSECAITAERVAEGFWRSQSDKCPNSYKGADYALSLSVITNGRYANWDRGLKEDGAHVWGPKSGGYIFIRKE